MSRSLPLCKISSRYDYLLSPPPIWENAHQVTRLVFWFFFQSTAKTPAPIFTINIRQMTSFRERMCLLGVSKTKFYISTPFSPKKQIFCPFLTGLRKFRVRKALTMEMLVIVSDGSCIVNRQIRFRESKYGVIGDPLSTGHVTQPNFGPKIG